MLSSISAVDLRQPSRGMGVIGAVPSPSLLRASMHAKPGICYMMYGEVLSEVQHLRGADRGVHFITMYTAESCRSGLPLMHWFLSYKGPVVYDGTARPCELSIFPTSPIGRLLERGGAPPPPPPHGMALLALTDIPQNGDSHRASLNIGLNMPQQWHSAWDVLHDWASRPKKISDSRGKSIKNGIISITSSCWRVA